MDLELHDDWELLEDSTPIHSSTAYLDGIERDSEGMIRSDHFSLHSVTRLLIADDVDNIDHVSVESDNPSWIDPVSDVNYSITKPVSEVSSTDSVCSDVSNQELAVFEERNVVSDESVENEAKMSVCEGIGEEKGREGGGGDVGKASGVTVWWKLPLDLLKYCLFKASPVWSLSVAAAMMGVVILGRRLYRMKQRSRSLQLKVAVDDKKVSQVMSRAARLNEAFSVVKRAPMIRPSLPAAGITPWPVMALR